MSETKLFILRPVRGKLVRDPWEPWYDKSFGFIVRARSEAMARTIAAAEAGDEGKEAWLDPTLSICKPLTNNGTIGVVMIDFHAA